MKAKLVSLLAGCLLFVGVPMRAQTPPTPPQPPAPGEAIKRILELSDQQVQQLNDLRKGHFQKVQDLGNQIRTLQPKKAQLLQSSTPDPAQVGTLVIQQLGLQKQVADAAKAYHDAALALLTATQKEKVTKIQEALRLAPQAGPLAAFGLIEGPGFGGGGPGFRGMGQRMRGMMGGFRGMGPFGAGPGTFEIPIQGPPHPEMQGSN